MRAFFISGSLGRMFTRNASDENFATLLDISGSEERIPLSHLRLIFGGTSDLEKVQTADVVTALRLLQERHQVDRALRLLDLLLHRETAAEIKREAAIVLEEFTSDERMLETVTNHALANPFDGDLINLTEFPGQQLPPRTYHLMNFVVLVQERIIHVRKGWASLPESLFKSSHERAAVELAAIRSGLFRALVSGEPIWARLVTPEWALLATNVNANSLRDVLDVWIGAIQHADLGAIAQQLIPSQSAVLDNLSEQFSWTFSEESTKALIRVLNLGLSHSDATIRAQAVARLRVSYQNWSLKTSTEYDASSIERAVAPLVPWSWVGQYVTTLTTMIRGKRPIEGLGHSRYSGDIVRDVLGVSSKRNIEQLEANELAAFASIVDGLYEYPLDVIPNKYRGTLIVLLDVGGAALLTRGTGGDPDERMTRSQITRAGQTIVRASILISRIKSLRQSLDPQARVMNAARIALAAEWAGFFSKSDSFMEPAWLVEIDECAQLLLGTASQSFSSAAKGSVFDSSINGADVLRAAATVALRFAGNLQKAEELRTAALQFFDIASRHCTTMDEHTLFLSRLFRLRFFEMELASRNGTLQAASTRLWATIHFMDDGPLADRRGGIGYLRFRALLTLAMNSDRSIELHEQVQAGVETLVFGGAIHWGSWRLLVDYYLYFLDDADAALNSIQLWKKRIEQEAGPRDRGVQFLEYVSAKVLLEAANRDPRRTKDAFFAYLSLLTTQALRTNTIQDFFDVCSMLSESDIELLKPSVDLMLPDGPALDWYRAAVRLTFGLSTGRTATDPAVVALGRLQTDEDESDIGLLGSFLRTARFQDRIILEFLSRLLFRRGRASRRKEFLTLADRLLLAGLHAKPSDIIWISRRIDIALERRQMHAAKELISQARKISPFDEVLTFQAARVDIIERRPGDATEKLQRLLPANWGAAEDGGVEFHPAVVDQLALAALHQRNYGKAADYYWVNLRRRPLDVRSHVGLGRVYFEQGRDHWVRALKSWGNALTLEADRDELGRFAPVTRTATLVANIFSNGHFTTELQVMLGGLLADQPDHIYTLARAFRSKLLAVEILDEFRRAADIRLSLVTSRAVAHLLRANQILRVCLRAEDRVMERTSVEWCRERGVLADYLAGAKGAYVRALMRKTEKFVWPEGQFLERERELVNHIATDGYLPGYYSEAERLARFLGTTAIEDIASFATYSAYAVLSSFEGRLNNPEKLMSRCAPEIGLMSISRLGKLHSENPPKLSPWVDEDILNIANRKMNGRGWEDEESELTRISTSTPGKDEAFLFAKGGVFFRPDVGGGDRTIAYLSVVPEWARSVHEFEHMAATM